VGIHLARRIRMRTKLRLLAVVVACVGGTCGCSNGRLTSSPSVVTLGSTGSATVGRFRTRDDAVTPTPMQIVINIVGSFGSNAFMPNPTMANVGDDIVFANTDVAMHHIVLDDGTDLGEVQPGQSSPAMSLATPAAKYHCTIHPTMIGSINGDLPPAEPYYPPPSDDYYGGYY
jgi:plastocyanin